MGPVTEYQSYHIVDLAAAFQNQSVVLRVVLTDDLEVSGFFVRPPEPPAYQAPGYVDEKAFSEVGVTVGKEPWALPADLGLEEEVEEDALLALDLVRSREEINVGSVFLLGHSLGAMLAPSIALRDGGVGRCGDSGLSGPTLPGCSS